MSDNQEFELENQELLEEIVEKSEPGPAPEIPGAVVEMQPAADAEVIRAADIVPEPEPKPKKVKVPVVHEEKFPAPVRVEALVFKARMKNSQSVRFVQAALIEQGYDEAGRDVQGWLCEGTQAALARFQAERGLVGDGTADEATIEALFAGSSTHYWDR
jgi:hypothetical protein